MTDSSQKYQNLLQWLPDSPLSSWSDRLPELLEKQLRTERWGDMPSWQPVSYTHLTLPTNREV